MNPNIAKIWKLVETDVTDADWRALFSGYVSSEMGEPWELTDFALSETVDPADKARILKKCLAAFYGKDKGAIAPKVVFNTAPTPLPTSEPSRMRPDFVAEVTTEQGTAALPLQSPGVPVGDAGAALLASMQAFVAGHAVKTPPLDEKAVRAIVESVLDSRPLPPRDVVELRLPGGQVKELPGRRHPVFGKVLKLAAARVNVLLVGPAGCGKTTLCRQVSEALELPFGHVSLSQGITEGKLIGKETAAGYCEAKPVEFYRDGGVWLWDEIDAADSNVLVNWNTAWSNGVVINGRGESIHRHKDSIQIAAANTFGLGADRTYVGRNQLDGSTLDRWYPVLMDYDTEFETSIAAGSPESEELCVWVHAVREQARLKGLRVIVSTRWIERGVIALRAGLSPAEVKADLTANLKADERKALGV